MKWLLPSAILAVVVVLFLKFKGQILAFFNQGDSTIPSTATNTIVAGIKQNTTGAVTAPDSKIVVTTSPLDGISQTSSTVPISQVQVTSTNNTGGVLEPYLSKDQTYLQTQEPVSVSDFSKPNLTQYVL